METIGEAEVNVKPGSVTVTMEQSGTAKLGVKLKDTEEGVFTVGLAIVMLVELRASKLVEGDAEIGIEGMASAATFTVLPAALATSGTGPARICTTSPAALDAATMTVQSVFLGRVAAPTIKVTVEVAANPVAEKVVVPQVPAAVVGLSKPPLKMVQPGSVRMIWLVFSRAAFTLKAKDIELACPA